jgi:hypothetical protein
MSLQNGDEYLLRHGDLLYHAKIERITDKAIRWRNVVTNTLQWCLIEEFTELIFEKL